MNKRFRDGPGVRLRWSRDCPWDTAGTTTAAVDGLVALRRGPGLADLARQPCADLGDRQPLLRERIALADGDRVVLERLLVDRERDRGAELVLPAGGAAGARA